VPELPLADVEGLVSRRPPWSEMVEPIDAAAPHGFVNYFRHDAPFQTVIWEDADGSAWFTADQPSTQFPSFDSPDIAQVGIELEHSSPPCWTRTPRGGERLVRCASSPVRVFSAARRL
jgi:hypothetical protein